MFFIFLEHKITVVIRQYSQIVSPKALLLWNIIG